MARLKLAIIIESIELNRFADRAPQRIAAIARPRCDFDVELIEEAGSSASLKRNRADHDTCFATKLPEL